jgi:hypothetical protein
MLWLQIFEEYVAKAKAALEAEGSRKGHASASASGQGNQTTNSDHSNEWLAGTNALKTEKVWTWTSTWTCRMLEAS